MEHDRMKVLCPVEDKNGKTFWVRMGAAFVNRDGSFNVFLNALPTNGRLHIRELDERDRKNDNVSPRESDSEARGSSLPV